MVPVAGQGVGLQGVRGSRVGIQGLRGSRGRPTRSQGLKVPSYLLLWKCLGEYFGRDSLLGYTSPLPKRYPRGHREKGAFKPNASRLEAVYDHCLIFNLPPEIKSFSCYQELKKGIDKAERELPVKSVNRILEVMKSKKIPTIISFLSPSDQNKCA